MDSTGSSDARTVLNEHLQCYALPFGVIGFIIDLAGYLIWNCVFSWLSFWRKELERPERNMFLNACGLLGGIAIASYNATRCKSYWPLILISIWRAGIAWALNTISIISNWESTLEEDEAGATWLVWLSPCYPSSIIVGLVGMGEIARQSWIEVKMKISRDILPKEPEY